MKTNLQISPADPTDASYIAQIHLSARREAMPYLRPRFTKTLSPNRLTLSTFQRNAKARAFNEAHGFRPVGFTDGDNDANEPDVQYEWTPGLGLT